MLSRCQPSSLLCVGASSRCRTQLGLQVNGRRHNRYKHAVFIILGDCRCNRLIKHNNRLSEPRLKLLLDSVPILPAVGCGAVQVLAGLTCSVWRSTCTWCCCVLATTSPRLTAWCECRAERSRAGCYGSLAHSRPSDQTGNDNGTAAECYCCCCCCCCCLLLLLLNRFIVHQACLLSGAGASCPNKQWLWTIVFGGIQVGRCLHQATLERGIVHLWAAGTAVLAFLLHLCLPC